MKTTESADVPNDVSAELGANPDKHPRHALAGWPMILAWLAMIIFALHASTHMVAAGDTWVAMACGRHFVNHGVDTVEPFSANSHKPGPTEAEIKTWPKWARYIADTVGIETVKKWHPTGWINQNWLTHVIFYSLVPKASYADGLNFTSNALVYWKFAIYIISVLCVYYVGRLLNVNPPLAAVFACFAMFIGRSFLDVRPAGFSNMLVAVFLLVLVLTTYRNILFIWLIVPVTVFWCNVHGGYIYVFIVLVPFIGLHLLNALDLMWTAIIYNVLAWPLFLLIVLWMNMKEIPIADRPDVYLHVVLLFLAVVALDVVLLLFKKQFVSIGFRGACHAIAAYAVAFAATVILNPFHLTNLTHTFVISFSKHAERWRDIHEWHPAFEWSNPVGTAVPFLVMVIIAWLVLALWLAVRFIPMPATPRLSKKQKPRESYTSPRIDLALIVIAAFTIYMAIRSRRFIPIAAIAACPVIAMFIDQIIRSIAARINFSANRSLVVPPMPRTLRSVLIFAGAAAVLFFGTWWGLKFKYVYLDPWPNDPSLNSIFMRMTASDAKPFHALKFIKDNKLAGKMFNYWTEGGFIAWGQQPDPNSGKTPLKLFMDGRAQAAYNRAAFDNWSYIMAGGPVVHAARLRGRALTSKDYTEIGKWAGNELRDKWNVWVVLMPAGQFSQPVVRGIEYNPEWGLAFFNGKQKLFVDLKDPRGRKLFDGMENGKTLFPDKFSRKLTIAHNLLLYSSKNPPARQRMLNYALEAFNLNPSPVPMLMIVNAARFPDTKDKAGDFCESYVGQFTEYGKKWARRDGYRLQIDAARIAADHLARAAAAAGDRKIADSYAEIRERCRAQLIAAAKRW